MFLTCKDYNVCWVCFYFCNLVHHIRKVFRCNFWMFHFDAKTPKRTSLRSSSASIGLFWTSKLKKVKYEQAKRERGAAQPRPCPSYRDAEGRVRYHGTSELKQMEFRVWNVRKDPFSSSNIWGRIAFSICLLNCMIVLEGVSNQGARIMHFGFFPHSKEPFSGIFLCRYFFSHECEGTAFGWPNC